MNIWMILFFYMVAFCVIIGISYAVNRFNNDDDTFEKIAKVIVSIMSLVLWPISLIADARKNKSNIKAKGKKTEPRTIGFKTRAELQAIEAKQNDP